MSRVKGHCVVNMVWGRRMKRCPSSPRLLLAILLSTNAATFTLVTWILPFHSLGYYSRVGPYGSPPYARCTKNTSQSETPTLFLITPTYNRLTQKVDLTSMCHTLMHIERVHWIVVEDSEYRTDVVTKLLQRCEVASTHLTVQRSILLNIVYAGSWRGLEQRNLGLDWIRSQCGAGSQSVFTERDPALSPDSCSRGVVYFADDDNKYDLRLFEEMRKTKRVSVWPVAYVAKLYYEGPICVQERVTAWHTGFRTREFPIDMAGFAVNLELVLRNPSAAFARSKNGNLETNFLHQLGMVAGELECRDGGRKEALVWHVRTEAPDLSDEIKAPSDPQFET